MNLWSTITIFLLRNFIYFLQMGVQLHWYALFYLYSIALAKLRLMFRIQYIHMKIKVYLYPLFAVKYTQLYIVLLVLCFLVKVFIIIINYILISFILCCWLRLKTIVKHLIWEKKITPTRQKNAIWRKKKYFSTKSVRIFWRRLLVCTIVVTQEKRGLWFCFSFCKKNGCW